MHKTIIALLFPLLAAGAFARDAIPVYGPAHAGVEDPDLLEKTVLDIGVLAINAHKPYSLRAGDGMTPGGVEVHAEGCITNFNGIKDATTNLNMHSYAIIYGPWSTRGDPDTFTLARGSNAWLRLVREDGQAYARYDFAILDGFGHMDATHYQFTVSNAEGDPLPVLEVSTNLLEGYTAADTNAIVTTRTDASHVSLVYEAPAGVEFIFFRMFKMEELTTGAHFYVPVVAESGITMGTNTWTEWPDIDGKIAAATISLASTAAVAAVSGRVDAIEADYVVSGDLAPFATTGSVASVERRVDRLEYPETCTLYWPANHIVDNMDENGTIYVPTNFPTRKLSLVFNDSGITNLYVVLDTSWQPDHQVEIEITPVYATSNVTTRATRVLGNGAGVLSFSAYNQYRRAVFTWDPAAGSYWSFSVLNMQYRMYWYGDSRQAYPNAWPSTVLEWEDRQRNIALPSP